MRSDEAGRKLIEAIAKETEHKELLRLWEHRVSLWEAAANTPKCGTCALLPERANGTARCLAGRLYAEHMNYGGCLSYEREPGSDDEGELYEVSERNVFKVAGAKIQRSTPR